MPPKKKEKELELELKLTQSQTKDDKDGTVSSTSTQKPRYCEQKSMRMQGVQVNITNTNDKRQTF